MVPFFKLEYIKYFPYLIIAIDRMIMFFIQGNNQQSRLTTILYKLYTTKKVKKSLDEQISRA